MFNNYYFQVNIIVVLLGIILIMGCDVPSEKAHVGPALDRYEVEVLSVENELKIDGESNTEITAHVKKNDQYIEGNLPDDLTLYAYHDNYISKLYIPEQGASIYTGGFEGKISITKIDPVSIVIGQPTYFTCQIDPAMYESGAQMMLEVQDATGNVVYDFSESMSDGSSIYSFSWYGFAKSGAGVSIGNYRARVKVGKFEEGGTFSEKAVSPYVTLYVKGEIGSAGSSVPYISGQSKLALVSPAFAEHRDKDRIKIYLKNKSGAVIAANDTNPLVISFIDPRFYRVSASPIPAFSLNCTLDGMPAMVSYTGTGDPSDNKLTVKVYSGDSQKEISYILDMGTKNISIVASGATKTFSYGIDDYNDAGYIIADLIQKIQNEAFAQAGIMIDTSGNTSINKDLHGATVSIRNIPEDNKREYKLEMGGSEYIFEFDTTTGSLTPQAGINLESAYSIDVSAFDTWLASLSSNYFASVGAAGVKAAGVKAQDISGADFLKLVTLAIIAPTVFAHSATYIVGGLLVGITLSETLPPHDYLGNVEINYGYTDDENFSVLKRLNGIAPPYKTVNIYRENSVSPLASAAVNASGLWEVNSNIPLDDGANKFSAAVKENGCEVESGNITVYWGDKKFAITSPADRQVVWGNFNTGKTKLSCNILIEGYAEKGKEVKVKLLPSGDDLDTFYANDSWEFSKLLTFKDENALNEGANQIEIKVDGKPIIKTVIAAYKFENTNVGKKYVIRKGDMLFVSKTFANPFDIIPKEPDHVGIYVGGRNIVEATWQEGVKEIDFTTDPNNQDYRNNNFKYAAQPRKIVSESMRNSVASKAIGFVDVVKDYDWPFLSVILNGITAKQFCPNVLGHYNGPTWGFYCSELAYFVWEDAIGQSNIISATGMDKSKMLWPWNDENRCPLLPAKLGHELMENRKLGWYE